MKIETVSGFRQISAVEGKYLYKDNNYFTKCIMLPTDLESDFKEVDSKPNEDLEKAISDKIAEIKAYDTSSNVNDFTINEIYHKWLTPDERASYKTSIESVKTLIAKNLITDDIVTFDFGDIKASISTDTATTLLAQIQYYADKCWLVTSAHKKEVRALKTIDEVKAYDITKDYPIEKLNFTL